MSTAEEIIKARPEDEVSDNESHSDSDSDNNSSESGTESGSSSGSGSGSDSDDEEGEYEIDLSDNEIYKGIYSLFEDEEGNNILNYISLLHNELQGLNEQMKNVRLIRKDMGRIADSLEKIVTLKEHEIEEKKAKKEQKK
jgi:hypothetical protein